MQNTTYFGPSSRLSRSGAPRFISRVVAVAGAGVVVVVVAAVAGVFGWSEFGVLAADEVVDVLGARPRDVDVLNGAGVVFSTGVTSFDGVDARESPSFDAFKLSGFFGLVAGAIESKK